MSFKLYHFIKILILIILVVSLVGFTFLMNSCTPEVCTTWSRFCVATLIGAPSPNEINECPSEVLICPGETAVLYWNVSSDVYLARGICSIPEVNFCSTLNSRINSS